MADQTDPVPPKPRRRRSTKFVLPDHHHDEVADERSAEHIEAFIAGLGGGSDHKTTGRTWGRRRRKARDRRPVELDTRSDWLAALQHESARAARYGRPASVLLVEPRDRQPAAEAQRISDHITAAIRAEARETDRATRVGLTSFRVLLPETDPRSAALVAGRLSRAVVATADLGTPLLDLRIDVISAHRSGSIGDALAAAERRRMMDPDLASDPETDGEPWHRESLGS